MRKRNSHWERLGLPLSLRLGKWNFYNNLVLSNAGDPYITENITHNSHQNIHIVNQNIDRKNIRRINETFSMLYDITTLQSIGLNCMVKQAGSTLKSSSFSETQETEKEYTSSYHSKGKGNDKIYQASLNYNWKSKNGKNTLQTVLDYLRSDETKELNHHYLYQYPEKNEEDNKCSNTGTVSDLWKAEINYIFLLNKHSRLKWGGDYYNKPYQQPNVLRISEWRRMAERRTRRSETIYHSVYNMNAGLYKYFLDQKFCINLSVYAILNKRRNLTTITNNNLSRIEENNKTPYQGACLNLIYKFDFGKKVKVKRAKSIQTTSDSYLRK